MPDQTVERIESGAPVDLLNQVQDPGGGRSQYLFDYGRLSFLTGEGVLFGYEEGTKWKYLWKDEVKQVGEGVFVRLDFQQQETDEVGPATVSGRRTPGGLTSRTHPCAQFKTYAKNC